MDNSSRTITITAHNDRDDIARGIEMSAIPSHPGQMRKLVRHFLLLAALSGVFALLTAYAPLAELWDILMCIYIFIGCIILLYISICWLFNVAGLRIIRRKQLRELEAEEDQSFTATYTFEEDRLTTTCGIISFTAGYSDLVQCDEHEDGLYFEREGYGYFYIPARYISNADCMEIARRLKEKCRAYRVFSPMRAPAEAVEVKIELPECSGEVDDQPVLVSELNWTFTDDEIDDAAAQLPIINKEKRIALIVYRAAMLILAGLMGIVFACVRPLPWAIPVLIVIVLALTFAGPRLFFGSFRKETRSFMKAGQESGSRVAFFDVCMLVRLMGDELFLPYSMITSVSEKGNFIFFTLGHFRCPMAVPLRAVDDKDHFLAMLCPNAANGGEKAEDAGLSRSPHPDSEPMHEARPDCGRTLITARFDGREITARRRSGLTELIIDGKVYAAKSGMIENQYSLHAWLDGIMYSFVFISGDYRMDLLANGRRIAGKVRII